VVRDFRKIKSLIKEKKYKGKIGLEVLISDMRYANGLEVGKWFKEIIDLYRFSERYNCQFIISSGATSIWEMISARCFESLLKLCDIKPERYWKELENWIELHNKPRAA
jgi:RNase P/RNase MRP subunit p30